MTHAAILTPPGTSAIATCGLRGDRAWEILRGLFRPQSATGRGLPEVPEAGRVWIGQMGRDVADEVVVCVKATQPLPFIEIHGHGGREVVRWLGETLAAEGAVLCSWTEFQRRIVADPLQALATETLTKAPTTRTASILLDQFHGAFASAVRSTLEALHQGNMEAAAAILKELVRHAPLGRHLVQPWRVVLAGAPNVGKSSLLNALAGFQRSVVSPMAGTTRDVVTVRLAIQGWPVEFADTAGLRQTEGDLEGQGISLARSAAFTADLILAIVETTTPPVWPDVVGDRLLCVINKSDLPSTWEVSDDAEAVQVSANTGENLAELCDRIGQRLVPTPPEAGAPMPFTPGLCQTIAEAERRLADGDSRGAQLFLEGLFDEFHRAS